MLHIISAPNTVAVPLALRGIRWPHGVGAGKVKGDNICQGRPHRRHMHLTDVSCSGGEAVQLKCSTVSCALQVVKMFVLVTTESREAFYLWNLETVALSLPSFLLCTCMRVSERGREYLCRQCFAILSSCTSSNASCDLSITITTFSIIMTFLTTTFITHLVIRFIQRWHIRSTRIHFAVKRLKISLILITFKEDIGCQPCHLYNCGSHLLMSMQTTSTKFTNMRSI